MSINYSNYPFLRDIENGTLETPKMTHAADAKGFGLCMGLLQKVWPHIYERVRANVCKPCRTYMDAIEKSMPCFDKLLDNASADVEPIDAKDWVDRQEAKPLSEEKRAAEDRMYEFVGNSYGCYILGHEHMVVYGIGKEPERHDFALEFIGDYLTRAFVQYGEDYAYFVTNHPSVSAVYAEISRYAIAVISQLQHECHMLTMFERYAKIETRYIFPKAKARVDLKSFESTLNDTRLKISIRDSRYFTNIIRDKGFLVKGHLRLQPKKVNGEWTRELIYIAPFEKHGYHRNAQIAKA